MDENGHVVQEDGVYQIKTQGQEVKILDNGRVYKLVKNITRSIQVIQIIHTM